MHLILILELLYSSGILSYMYLRKIICHLVFYYTMCPILILQVFYSYYFLSLIFLILSRVTPILLFSIYDLTSQCCPAAKSSLLFCHVNISLVPKICILAESLRNLMTFCDRLISPYTATDNFI